MVRISKYKEDFNFQPQELSHRYDHVLIPVLIRKDPAPTDTLESTEMCIGRDESDNPRSDYDVTLIYQILFFFVLLGENEIDNYVVNYVIDS
ncbi:hypothetical protein AYI69_g9304 [Smittium culicis]|uniref:Uncharacterized protein n=1 Tax=Smittium culicis TaxID=133412 RepID=A0A1R1XDK1_9FUNG|nr:hypothetical protein AYI69_g9304 [Smittium culicis]